MPPDPVLAYLFAHEAVIAAGWGEDIDWQDSRSLERVTEQDFLREHAFVCANSGMRATVIRGLWPRLRAAFDEFPSAAEVAACTRLMRPRALAVLNSPPKIDAIFAAAQRVVDAGGWPTVRGAIRMGGVQYLGTWPYMGPIIRWHLAKNIGLDVAKPDRHLVRIAAAFGEADVQVLCERIARKTGDRVAVVDLVLWRFAASVRPGDYLPALLAAANPATPKEAIA